LEQALAGAPAGSPQQLTFTSMLEEVHRLKAIVQKLLLLSLADSGRLELHREPADLGQLLRNVIEDCRALAPSLDIDHRLPATRITVLADTVLLEQALQNLAGNAVKYNREGGSIRFEFNAAGDVAEISVGNTGPGISAGDRPHVFERFFRGDRARIPPSSGCGVGLGLSLSREIFRAHGRDLVLAPARTGDDWTQFVATIPIAPSGAGQSAGAG
jgi:signal transduction histidine kinase